VTLVSDGVKNVTEPTVAGGGGGGGTACRLDLRRSPGGSAALLSG